MNLSTATKILTKHSIEHRLLDGSLEILDTYTQDGCYYAMWIPCPETVQALYHWLGY